MDLLDLLPTDAGGTGRADHTPVVHIVTPDFSTLCREDFLEARALGDRCAISPHRETSDRSIRWANVTCQWCRSLGHDYYRYAVRTMTRRAA